MQTLPVRKGSGVVACDFASSLSSLASKFATLRAKCLRARRLAGAVATRLIVEFPRGAKVRRRTNPGSARLEYDSDRKARTRGRRDIEAARQARETDRNRTVELHSRSLRIPPVWRLAIRTACENADSQGCKSQTGNGIARGNAGVDVNASSIELGQRQKVELDRVLQKSCRSYCKGTRRHNLRTESNIECRRPSSSPIERRPTLPDPWQFASGKALQGSQVRFGWGRGGPVCCSAADCKRSRKKAVRRCAFGGGDMEVRRVGRFTLSISAWNPSALPNRSGLDDLHGRGEAMIVYRS